MIRKPVIFISATSDLRSARELVGKVLYSMGFEPRWQDLEATDGGELTGLLRDRIRDSDFMIQLVGKRYGAEPPQPMAEFGRVSYTKFEALNAESLGKKVIYHFIEPSFSTDAAPSEEEERIQLQEQYRQKLIAVNKLRHKIDSNETLELSIRRIKDELAELRVQGDRRFRKLLGLSAVVAACVVAVGALVIWGLRQQRKTHEQVVSNAAQTNDQLAEMRKELLEAIAPKPLADKQAAPAPLPPELIEKAKILLERGNAEDQALAKIALKQHEEADRIIQELKSKPGNPIEEAARLLTLEGDNWYQAGQPDKAIEPYEKAMALRPSDFDARNNVVVAHAFARLGNIANHQRRAIELAEETLTRVVPGSAAWAATQNNLGIACSDLPTGDRGENLRKAIAAYESALTVRTKQATPADWAATQFNLALIFRDVAKQPGVDPRVWFTRAIAAGKAALLVYEASSYPEDHANTAKLLTSLRSAYESLSGADKPPFDSIEPTK
jgi:tetratricopeptide (TPR) repeat protein